MKHHIRPHRLATFALALAAVALLATACGGGGGDNTSGENGEAESGSGGSGSDGEGRDAPTDSAESALMTGLAAMESGDLAAALAVVADEHHEMLESRWEAIVESAARTKPELKGIKHRTPDGKAVLVEYISHVSGSPNPTLAMCIREGGKWKLILHTRADFGDMEWDPPLAAESD